MANIRITASIPFGKTLENTAKIKSDRLYFIIGEAHRGMQGTAAGTATSIMQRFIKGSVTHKLSPIPIVIGMSATSARFNQLVGDTNSTLQKVIITPNDVRASGLKIVISPNFYWRLNKTDNSSEKELCKFVIGTLCDFASGNFDYESYIEKIFSNPIKKKMFSFDFHKQPYLKPFEFTDYISIHREDEDILLDLIGKELLKLNKWTYGVIPKEKRGELANYIVGVLYNQENDMLLM